MFIAPSPEMIGLIGLPLLVVASIVGLWWLVRYAAHQRTVSVLPDPNKIAITITSQDDNSDAVVTGEPPLSTQPSLSVSSTTVPPVTHDIGDGVSVTERERVLIKRITEDPTDVEAYDLLGQLYMVQHNLVDARDCFTQILILEPQYPKAKRQLQRVKKLMSVQNK